MSTLSVGTIKSNTSAPPIIQNSSGVEIGTTCRAWVNFNGTGTVAIRASFNVTSITDNGTGDYTVNFTTAMPDANYCSVFGRTTSATVNNSGFGENSTNSLKTTTQLRLMHVSGGTPAPVDGTYCGVAIFR